MNKYVIRIVRLYVEPDTYSFVRDIDDDSFEQVYDLEQATIFTRKKDAFEFKKSYNYPDILKIVKFDDIMPEYLKWKESGMPSSSYHKINRKMSRPYNGEGLKGIIEFFEYHSLNENRISFEDYTTWPRFLNEVQFGKCLFTVECYRSQDYSEVYTTIKIVVAKNTTYKDFKKDIDRVKKYIKYKDDKGFLIFPIMDFECHEYEGRRLLINPKENKHKITSDRSERIIFEGTMKECFEIIRQNYYYRSIDMKVELEWKHEICDTGCYDEIFMAADGKYKDIDIFSRILPIKDDKYRFLADVMLVRGEETLPLQRKVNTFKEGIEWAHLAIPRNIPDLLNEVNYVLGFIRVNDQNDPSPKVLLMRKNRPESQKDKLNGFGGKIKPKETPVEAVMRKAGEEVISDFFNKKEFWDNFYNLHYSNKETGQSGTVHCYRFSLVMDKSEKFQEIIDSPKTDETFELVDYQDIVLKNVNVVNNLPLIVQAMFYHSTDEGNPPMEVWEK